MSLLKLGLTLFAIFQIQIPIEFIDNLYLQNYENIGYQQDIIIKDNEKTNDVPMSMANVILESNDTFVEIVVEDEENICIDIDETNQEKEFFTEEIVEETVEEKLLPQNLVVVENKQVYSNIINEIITLTNKERVVNGLNELQYDDELTNIAMERAIEGACNNYFSHTRPNGEDFVSLYEDYNVCFTICGENLGRYQLNASEVFNDWMNSPTHKENILYDFDYIGIGVAIDSDGNYYFVQEFKK